MVIIRLSKVQQLNMAVVEVHFDLMPVYVIKLEAARSTTKTLSSHFAVVNCSKNSIRAL